MPLQIIRQDITKLSCGAIVNPTDARYSGAGGTDFAVHRAAGPALDAACAKLPPLSCGEVAVTEGFRLPCSYIIHTTGPVWQGGSRSEGILLRACYLNALLKARQLGLSSIAFPLISSGTFGFPRDRVLRIAQDAISDFLNLNDEDMEVTLCIYDKDAYSFRAERELELLLGLRSDFFAQSLPIGSSPTEPGGCFFSDDALPDLAPCCTQEGYAAPVPEPKAAPLPREKKRGLFSIPKHETPSPEDLTAWIKKQDDSFAVMLLKLIDRKGMTDVQCYKKANVSKKTFWKINNDAAYRPSKPTAIAFAIALELTLDETQQLLRTVGFTLSHSSTFDMIIEYYIRSGIYDIFEINAALYKYDQPCLGC